MITTVNEFKVGQDVIYEGVVARIYKFPSRNTVCLENLNHSLGKDVEWKTCKITIKDLRKTNNK